MDLMANPDRKHVSHVLPNLPRLLLDLLPEDGFPWARLPVFPAINLTNHH